MQWICTKENSLSWKRRESSTWAEVDPQGHLFLWETFSLPSLVPRTWREELLVLKFPRGAHLHFCVIDQRQNDSNTRKKMTSLVSSASDSVAIAPLDRKIGRSASWFFSVCGDHRRPHYQGAPLSCTCNWRNSLIVRGLWLILASFIVTQKKRWKARLKSLAVHSCSVHRSCGGRGQKPGQRCAREYFQILFSCKKYFLMR